MTKIILPMMSYHIWTIYSSTRQICARIQKDESGQLPFPSMTYWKIGLQDAFELLRYFWISLIKHFTGKIRVEIVLVHKIWNAWLEGLPIKSYLHWQIREMLTKQMLKLNYRNDMWRFDSTKFGNSKLRYCTYSCLCTEKSFHHLCILI